MRRWLLAAAALPLAACGESVVGPISDLPRPLTVAEQEVIASSNAFAFRLLREVARGEPEGNLFLSPLSASMALGMTLNGARGETFHAMRGTLGFDGLSQPQINTAFHSLIDLLRGLDPRVQMLLGNSIWYDRTFPFEQAFFDTTRAYFDAEVAGLDFGDEVGSARTVNAWVRESTRDRIESIVDPAEFRDAVMFLINAIYFKGDWTTRFDAAATYQGPFFDAPGTRQLGTVQMMRRAGRIRHFRGDGFSVVDLPYGGGAFSMTVLLPDAGAELRAVVESLDPGSWRHMVDGLQEAEMEIHLPKFRLEYEKSFKEPLTAMGMGLAFGLNGVPDFTGMSPLGRELVISDVFQKTFVEVNEQGTEAAAVTKVVIERVSAQPAVVVNRPFLFAIRERFSGALLFVGTIAVPPAT